MENFTENEWLSPVGLLEIITQRKEEFLKGLYDGKVDVNYYDSILPHPIVYGIYTNAPLPIIQKLLDLGADVNAQCVMTGTLPIHHAIISNRFDVLQLLVQSGANINSMDDVSRKAPLHYACENGNVEMVNYLCEIGAECDAWDLDGYTPLHIAAENGSIKCIARLVAKGMDLNAKSKLTGDTPLHIACKTKEADLVINLLFLGAIPNIKNALGVSPLDIVKDDKKFALVNILQKAEANLVKGKGIMIKGVDECNLDLEEDRRVG
jgi:ankyrin repeat protein